MREFGFDGTEIKRTEFDYVTDQNWIGRYLVKLVKFVKIFEGGSNVPISQVDYAYDTNQNLTSYTGVPMYETNIPAYRGNLTAVSKNTNAGDPSQGETINSTVRYDIVGNVVETTDPNGNTSQVEYSVDYHYAYPTRTISAIPDPNGDYGSDSPLITSANYNFNTGLLIASTDANYQTTNYQYIDPINRITRINKPNGGWINYDYSDMPGDWFVNTSTALDSERYTNSYQYLNGRGSPVRSIQQEGGSWLIVDTQYDVMSRPWRVSNPYRLSQGNGGTINPSELWTTTIYDALGRVRSIKMPDEAEVKTEYYGAQVLVTDQQGKQRISRANALGQLAEVWEIKASDTSTEAISFPNHPEITTGYRTKYTYDALDNLTRAEQGVQIRSFAYDSLSRLTDSITPESGHISYIYDRVGNLKEKTDGRGIITKYAYDGLNRNITVTYENDPLNTPIIKRYYDSATNGKGVLWKSEKLGNEGTSVTIPSYDATGRPLVQEQRFWIGGMWGAPYTVQRSYDLAGNVLSQTYPSGHAVNYQYDSSGRTQSFRGNLGDGLPRDYATEIEYDEADRMVQEKLGTGIATAASSPIRLYHKLGYNVRGQLFEVRLSTRSRQQSPSDWNRGCLLFYYSDITQAAGLSDRDNNGNVVRSEHWIPFNDANDNTITYRFMQDKYAYDALNRLTSITENENGQPSVEMFKQEYTYDRYGNRTINVGVTSPNINRQQFEVEVVTNRLYAPNDLSLPVNQRRMKYDAAGNLEKDIYSGTGTYTYDAENRIASATDSNTGTVSRYTYDADGRRVRRNTISQGEVWQVYGIGGELVAEYAANSPSFIPSKEYGYRSGQLLITTSNGDEQRLTRFIQQLYRGAWGRDATTAEIQNWFGWLAAQGATSQSALLAGAKMMAATLLGSAPQNRTDRQFVSDLYWTYFGRGVSQSEEDYWAARLAVGSSNPITRSELRQVCESWGEFTTLVASLWGAGSSENERAEHFLWNVYLGAIGAVPSSAQMQPQIDELNIASEQGQDAVINKAGEIARAKIESSAYNNRNRTDEQYVTDLYQVFWQRPPDQSGWNYWVRQTQIYGRTWVLNRFANSTAFRQSVGTLYIEVLWLVPDQLGSPRMIAGRTGSLASIKRHDYLPFGEELIGIGGRTTQQGYVSDGVRQKFTGQERDIETGLDYFLSRHYASTQGRFISPDEFKGGPIELFSFVEQASANPTFYADSTNPQTLNKYQYCLNNPLRFKDPYGHQQQDQQNWLSRWLGALLKSLLAQKDPEHAAYDSVARGPMTYDKDKVTETTTMVFGKQMESYNEFLSHIDFGANKLIASVIKGNTKDAAVAAVFFTVNVATLGNGKKAVLIGEKMQTRVIPVAGELGAKWFKARGTNPANWLANNVKWIQRQIAGGKRIFDIGPANEVVASPYYQEEVNQLMKVGFIRVERGKVEVEGTMYTLYEWIKR